MSSHSLLHCVYFHSPSIFTEPSSLPSPDTQSSLLIADILEANPAKQEQNGMYRIGQAAKQGRRYASRSASVPAAQVAWQAQAGPDRHHRQGQGAQDRGRAQNWGLARQDAPASEQTGPGQWEEAETWRLLDAIELGKDLSQAKQKMPNHKLCDLLFMFDKILQDLYNKLNKLTNDIHKMIFMLLNAIKTHKPPAKTMTEATEGEHIETRHGRPIDDRLLIW